jgi:hypothetical protein
MSGVPLILRPISSDPIGPGGDILRAINTQGRQRANMAAIRLPISPNRSKVALLITYPFAYDSGTLATD